MSKRPRIACYFANEEEKADISKRMEAVRIKLAGRMGAVTISDVLEELLSFYEDCLDTISLDDHQSQSASDPTSKSQA